MKLAHLLITGISLGLTLAAGFAIASDKFKDFGDLTEENVEAYYARSKKIHLKPYDEFAAFYINHTADSAKITLNIVNHMPDGKDRKQTLTMDKAALVKKLPEQYNFIKDARILHKLIEIEVAPNGKSATIKNTMFTTAYLDHGKIEFRSKSTCTDSLVGDRQVTLKLSESKCDTETFYVLPKGPSSSATPKPSSEKKL